MRLFRYGVYGAYIDKLSHTALFADMKNVSGSAHIHPKELCAGLCGDGNYTRAVNYAGAAVCVRKEFVKGIFVANVARYRVNLFRKQLCKGVAGKNQRIYVRTAANKLLRHCSAEKTGRTSKKIFIIHNRKASFQNRHKRTSLYN